MCLLICNFLVLDFYINKLKLTAKVNDKDENNFPSFEAQNNCLSAISFSPDMC